MPKLNDSRALPNRDPDFYPPEAERRARLLAILDELETGEFSSGFVYKKRVPGRVAVTVPLPDNLSATVQGILRARAITQLYSHQALAYQAIAGGRHCLVVTPTASGKSWCYNLPVLERLANDESATALYLFPTKALCRDQEQALLAMNREAAVDSLVATYDADTNREQRKQIRDKTRILLTNPDMLHTAILPHHTLWQRFFSGLRYVILDELHSYRGVFGSHVANVIRRLKRVAGFYGAAPVFVATSATIGNPLELGHQALEVPLELIADSGAPSGEKLFVFMNPPLVNRNLGIRKSYLAETADICEKLLRAGVPTIVFARSRLNVEILLKELRTRTSNQRTIFDRLRGYRGGYLPAERRDIERRLRDGRVVMVITTNALELGIDIGNLDVCVMAGYPGTIASTWQQAGRAGRKGAVSAAILVASSDPLDQYIITNPSYFFGENPELGLLDPDNLMIALSHIQCAAFELPFHQDEQFVGEGTTDYLEFLEGEGVLHRSGTQWHWMSHGYPSNEVSLRSVTAEQIVIQETKEEKSKIIGELDYEAGPALLHPGAIYIHESYQYIVEELDLEARCARVRAVDAAYFTRSIARRQVKVLDVYAETSVGDFVMGHGEVQATNQVIGFKKIKFSTMETEATEPLTLPEGEMHTTAFWCKVAAVRVDAVIDSRENLELALIGVGKLLHTAACFLAMCSPQDLAMTVGAFLGGWSMQPTLEGYKKIEHAKTIESMQDPTVFLCDAYPGGVGFSELLYGNQQRLLATALTIVNDCGCSHGCPSCIGAGAADVLDRAKPMASALLQLMAAPTQPTA